MSKYYLNNCQLVLPEETLLDGSLLIEAEEIIGVCPTSVKGDVKEIDLQGATLMPGMIDLHSDAIESMAEPRSGIYLPFELAAAQIDLVAATNGITTFYNAISFAGEELGLRQPDAPSRLVQAVHDYRSSAVTDQRVHCRFEVTCGESLPKLIEYIRLGYCQFISYMDHSPGQGQFQDEANYRNYMTTRYGYDDEHITKLLESKAVVTSDRSVVQQRVDELAAVARQYHVPLAGHDADSAAHVAEMVGLGAVLAEFPMSHAAAEAGALAELHQCVGSVNVIRGGSQRTGMSAQRLIELGQADCLCSDYVPATLLPAVLKLASQLERPQHEMVRLVTSNPARAAGLNDRGAIRVGLRADLVSFYPATESRAFPRVQSTWAHGRLAYSSGM